MVQPGKYPGVPTQGVAKREVPLHGWCRKDGFHAKRKRYEGWRVRGSES